jgi:hypothetical protein
LGQSGLLRHIMPDAMEVHPRGLLQELPSDLEPPGWGEYPRFK